MKRSATLVFVSFSRFVIFPTQLFVFLVSVASAETVKLEIVNQCIFSPGDMVLLHSIQEFESKPKNRRLYQLYCSVLSKKCLGVRLDLDGSNIDAANLSPQPFTADSVTVSASGAVIVYNNVTWTADKSSFVERASHKRNEKTIDEVWRGKCEVRN